MGSPADFEAMTEFVTRKGIHPVVGSVFPIDQAAAAFELMERGGQCGKIVIRISD